MSCSKDMKRARADVDDRRERLEFERQMARRLEIANAIEKERQFVKMEAEKQKIRDQAYRANMDRRDAAEIKERIAARAREVQEYDLKRLHEHKEFLVRQAAHKPIDDANEAKRVQQESVRDERAEAGFHGCPALASRRGMRKYRFDNGDVESLRQCFEKADDAVLEKKEYDAWMRHKAATSAHSAPTARGCCVCMGNDAFISFVPCGHQCVCGPCARLIMDTTMKCPMCRAVSTSAIRIFN